MRPAVLALALALPGAAAAAPSAPAAPPGQVTPVGAAVKLAPTAGPSGQVAPGARAAARELGPTAAPSRSSGQVPSSSSATRTPGPTAASPGPSGQAPASDASAARKPGPSGQVPWDRALAAAAAAVARADLERSYGAQLGEKARAAGLDGAAIARLLGDLLPHCPPEGACERMTRERAVGVLVDTLGHVGGVDVAGLLLRLDARGFYNADGALEDILTGAMADALPAARCAPPGLAELAAARAGLADFAVLRQRGERLVAEAPTAAELDDLAYFFAAVAHAGPEVGAAQERPGGGPLRPGAPDPERARLAAAALAARTAGDLEASARHGRDYLRHLGWPGPIDTAAEDTWAWGGARFSYALRDLAQISEVLGDHALAGQLYRRAQPGGGMCGTSVSYRWQIQVRGAIRAAERQGDCRAALPERLLDVDAFGSRPSALDPRDYGPMRLQAAGFDVPRLYRGALLTAGRDAEPAALQAALQTAPEPLRTAALARLARRGPEAWDRRVYAIEGLADHSGRADLPALAERLATTPAAARERLLQAIGAVAERPEFDPCAPELLGFGMGSASSIWERQVRPLGDRCEDSLRLADADALARALLPWLKSQDPETRRAAAEALGRIGHRRALAGLRALRRDPHAAAGTQRCDDAGKRCKPYYAVREAVAEAIARIQARSRDDAAWRRNDPRG